MTELLSPAGNMECLKAAVIAGADAVYLAGRRFGARASAENFSDEELISALDYAHTYNKRIYLTLNTLIKEREWKDIYDYVKPLYKAGLDGIIIQDIGLITYLKERFPGLPLHASTQMTVTHTHSAKLLKSMGICRVVTARELSLKEIEAIKNNTGLELEVFIHGAMCYSYSGACLFSSFLGGRSGNRGRCAGPCRLPYNGSDYPLSLTDMCLAEDIPALIDAGIDSFKIEGRLKSPEYVTGVTKLYRRLIDEYVTTGKKATTEVINDELSGLYLRGGHSSSYLYVHNSADMVSMGSPSYIGPDANTEDKLKKWRDEADIRMSIRAKALFHVKQPSSLTLIYDNNVSVTVTGDVVEEATGRPATAEDTESRIRKTGGTPYVITECDINMDDNCFLPVGALNELRRRAIDELTKVRLTPYIRTADALMSGDEDLPESENISDVSGKCSYCNAGVTASKVAVDVSVMSAEQLYAVLGADVTPERIYIPYDLIYSGKLTSDELIKALSHSTGVSIYMSLPRIYRSRSDEYMESFLGFIEDKKNVRDCNIEGILIKNLEQLNCIKGRGISNLNLVTDHSIYVWNKHALNTVLQYSDEVTLPLECSLYEIKDEITGTEAHKLNMVVYGRIPLMVSANCLLKTYGKCKNSANGFITPLKDRYGKKEPVYANCIHCFNEIYNAVYTSYHKKLHEIKEMGIGRLRIDLTDERADAERTVLEFYKGEGSNMPDGEYTAGHMEKGAI